MMTLTPHSEPAESRSSDDRLESVLVCLLGHLEQQVVVIRRSDNAKEMARTVKTSLGMLVMILNTGLEIFGAPFFTRELPTVWLSRERCKLVLDALDQESKSKLFGFLVTATESTRTKYRELGAVIGESLSQLLCRLVEEVQSPTLREDVREGTVALVDEFLQRW